MIYGEQMDEFFENVIDEIIPELMDEFDLTEKEAEQVIKEWKENA